MVLWYIVVWCETTLSITSVDCTTLHQNTTTLTPSRTTHTKIHTVKATISPFTPFPCHTIPHHHTAVCRETSTDTQHTNHENTPYTPQYTRPHHTTKHTTLTPLHHSTHLYAQHDNTLHSSACCYVCTDNNHLTPFLHSTKAVRTHTGTELHTASRVL